MKVNLRRVYYYIATIILMVSLPGCSRIQPGRMAAGEPTISPRLQIPALASLSAPGPLTIKQLEEALRQFVNEGNGSVAQRLNSLYSQWKVVPPHGASMVIESDLNGDGINEIVTAMNDASSSVGSGTIFIIYRKDGRNLVDRVPTTVLGAGLNTVDDVERDGLPEIIWSSTSGGANTIYTTYFVTSWEPGRVESLSTGIDMSYSEIAVEGGDLLVSGGLQGGYGAGKLQRVRTDRYSWQGEKFVLVDQKYATSPYSYHLLQDGILAEQWNHAEEAAAAFRKALEPDREVAPIEDNVPPEWRDRFVDAVRIFAGFRLDVLLGRPDRDTACRTVTEWARAHPEFLQALNIPRGWANPQWKMEDLCGPLPNLKGAKQP